MVLEADMQGSAAGKIVAEGTRWVEGRRMKLLVGDRN